MNKKAFTVNFILFGVVLPLVSLIIILSAFFSSDLIDQSDRELCAQSVSYRASFRPTESINFIPLQCRTDKICVTSKAFGKGDCDEFIGEEYSTYRVSQNIEIEQLIAQEMVSCWSTLGKGEISLFEDFWTNQAGIGTVYPTCVVCTRIAYDYESLASSEIDFSQINVEDYMRRYKVPGSEVSYLEFISGKGTVDDFNFEDFSKRIADAKENLNELEENEGLFEVLENINLDENSKGDSEEFNLNDINSVSETAIIFAQISSPSRGETLFSGAIAAGGFIYSAYRAPIIGTALGHFSVIFGAVSIPLQQVNVGIQRGIAAGTCGDVIAGNEARDGCSAVRTINYGVEDLSSYCSVIESLP